jgi:AcrR family transcriptional regulator
LNKSSRGENFLENLSRKEREKKFRESVMVEAAEELFVKKGFDNVTMNEIAGKAEFTKRTLYRYFNSKEDLFFAVALKGFKKMAEYCQQGFAKGDKGFEKLSNGLHAYLDFAQKNPDTFRIINSVGHIRRKTKNSPKLQKWMKFDNRLFNSIAELLKQGKDDGSVRQNIEPLKGTFSIIFMATGFFRLLGETGANYADHFDLDLEEFSEYSLNLLLDAIKS